jgi:hypothetical protein
MKRAFVITAAVLLSSFPAFGQNVPGGGEGREGAYSGRDRDLMDLLRGIGREELRHGGAAFFLRQGDAMVAVRCDPQESMRACVDVTLTLLERARSAQAGAAGTQPPSR